MILYVNTYLEFMLELPCTLLPLWFLRRGGSTRISPGMYGYGKMPYVVSSQRDSGQTVYRERKSRSPSNHRYNSYRQQQKKYRNTQQSPSQNTHNSISQSASWVPLHQPGLGIQSSGKHQPPGTLTSGFSQASAPGRLHNTHLLPASSCSGAASQYKMCNMNVRILNILGMKIMILRLQMKNILVQCMISLQAFGDVLNGS